MMLDDVNYDGIDDNYGKLWQIMALIVLSSTT